MAESTALALRADSAALDSISNLTIDNPVALMQHMRALQEKAFILSPAVGRIAPGYVATPVVVVIDPSVDPKSGRGADVYHSPAIHAKRKIGDRKYEPEEVSLNKYALLKMLNGAGVDVQPTHWTIDPREHYLWMATVEGFITDFDGRIRRLPAGTATLDARDGSADIGEWSKAAWAEQMKLAEEKKKKTPPEDRWKVEPEPINGWTAGRVMQVRKFGAALTETKALNRLARNLGIRQSYTIEELRSKPFIIYRPMFNYDLQDPEVKRMLTAANLGARQLLYPQPDPQAPISHAHGEPPIEGSLAVEETSEPEEQVATDKAPQDAIEASFEEVPKEAAKPAETRSFAVKSIKQAGQGLDTEYFIETDTDLTFYTRDASVAKACAASAKKGSRLEIDAERVGVRGHTYLAILNAQPAGGLKL
jgi:hypothetical protein